MVLVLLINASLPSSFAIIFLGKSRLVISQTNKSDFFSFDC